MKISVLWIVRPYTFTDVSEERAGDSTFLLTDSEYLPDYTASHPRIHCDLQIHRRDNFKISHFRNLGTNPYFIIWLFLDVFTIAASRAWNGKTIGA
jgi:hypothetical protein